jgi:RND family efflux transporter MFP subunit
MSKIFLFLLSSYLFLQAASYSGIVEPIKKVNLSLSIDGIIKTIKIKEGQKAKKNNVILSLDSKIQQLEVKRRKILLDDETRRYYLEKEISIVENMYNMSKKLYNKTGSISKNELNNYELKYYNLKSDLEEIINNKKREQIQYDLENEKLKLYELKAPFKGVVTKIKLDIGEWGKRGESIVEFVDSTTCFVETNIPESQIRNIKLNQKYTINIKRDSKIVQKDGKVTYISPIADSSSGLILIKIEFDNRNLDIIPGVIASININTVP